MLPRVVVPVPVPVRVMCVCVHDNVPPRGREIRPVILHVLLCAIIKTFARKERSTGLAATYSFPYSARVHPNEDVLLLFARFLPLPLIFGCWNLADMLSVNAIGSDPAREKKV